MKSYAFYPRFSKIFLIAFFVLITHIIFFDIFRGAIFNIIPHDDYSYYLLHLLGEKGGRLPGGPFYYRVLSVTIAAPFYYILPVYKFTNLNNISPEYLKAVEAISFVTFLSIIGTGIFIYLIAKKRFKKREDVSLLASLISVLLFKYTAIYGVDPTAIFIITIIIYYIHNKMVYSILIFVSIIINEKIILFFLLLGFSRYILGKNKSLVYMISPLIATALYFFIRGVLLPAPGCENQLQPSTYIPSLTNTFILSLTLKGIMLNLVPTLIVVVLYILAVKDYKVKGEKYSLFFSPIDIIPLVGMFLIAYFIDSKYTVGRISMHCFPLYLPRAVGFLANLRVNKDR